MNQEFQIGTDTILSPGAIAAGAKIVQRSKHDFYHPNERTYWDEARNVDGLESASVKQEGFCGRVLTVYFVKGEKITLNGFIKQ